MVFFFDLKVAADIGGDLGCGGRGEAEDARDFEFGRKPGELEVVGAEVVSPFRDAVGFIDGEERQFHLGEAGPEFFVGESFGGNVEELDGSIFEVPVEGGDLVSREGGIEAGGRDALGNQRVDLVFHQGDEGRDDKGEAIEKQGGELITERFSATCWENSKRRAVGENGVDDFFLPVAEMIVSEVSAEG